MYNVMLASEPVQEWCMVAEIAAIVAYMCVFRQQQQ
jgi:hypothetical protein